MFIRRLLEMLLSSTLAVENVLRKTHPLVGFSTSSFLEAKAPRKLNQTDPAVNHYSA